jgi:hypothetical protein
MSSLHRPHDKSVFSEQLCAHIVCEDVRANFLFDFLTFQNIISIVYNKPVAGVKPQREQHNASKQRLLRKESTFVQYGMTQIACLQETVIFFSW